MQRDTVERRRERTVPIGHHVEVDDQVRRRQIGVRSDERADGGSGRVQLSRPLGGTGAPAGGTRAGDAIQIGRRSHRVKALLSRVLAALR